MSYGWSNLIVPPLTTIHTGHMQSLGIVLAKMASSRASTVWPTANLAMFVPFLVWEPVVAAQLFWENGAAVSGNVDVGIYDEGLTKIVSAGSTAQFGISTIQAVNITDTLLGKGIFYFALALDNITGNFQDLANAAGVPLLRAMGMFQMASAFALPATATAAALATSDLPSIGLTIKAVL